MTIERIKETILTALYTHFELKDKFALKGGSALDMAYKLSGRPSMDIDLSMRDDFADPATIAELVNKVFTRAFDEKGFVVLDYSFTARPEIASDPIWGGYEIRFKILAHELDRTLSDQRARQRHAVQYGSKLQQNIIIQISKHEYYHSTVIVINTIPTQVYTPQMVCIEKLRALCQQMNEYTLNTTRHPRARDFYDIVLLQEHYTMNVTDTDFVRDVIASFASKKVPLSLLPHLEQYREYHRRDFTAVLQTIPSGSKEIRSYDVFFDRVLALVGLLLASPLMKEALQNEGDY